MTEAVTLFEKLKPFNDNIQKYEKKLKTMVGGRLIYNTSECQEEILKYKKEKENILNSVVTEYVVQIVEKELLYFGDCLMKHQYGLYNYMKENKQYEFYCLSYSGRSINKEKDLEARGAICVNDNFCRWIFLKSNPNVEYLLNTYSKCKPLYFIYNPNDIV